jgi:hypothetical protein
MTPPQPHKTPLRPASNGAVGVPGPGGTLGTGRPQQGDRLALPQATRPRDYFAAAAALVMSVWALLQMPLMLLPMVT